MTDKETGESTEFGNFFGEKLYEKRARRALPLLVRQAKAQQTIFYADLANELEMPNPRNLNYVLGLIGNEMQKLESIFGQKVPPIQCLVINQITGLPGEGIGWFVPNKSKFKKLSKANRKAVLKEMLVSAFAFSDWDHVLAHFDLESVAPLDAKSIIDKGNSSTGRGGKGEGEIHKALKESILRNPELVGLKDRYDDISTEQPFPSGDSVDVSFKNGNEWVGVEVKGSKSDEADLVRGLFQCVKYAALMDAMRMVEQSRYSTRVIMALGGEFPQNLLPLKNILGVRVIDNLQT